MFIFYLFDRGYRPFLQHDSPRSYGSYIEIHGLENVKLLNEGLKTVELDALMAGNSESFKKLCGSTEDRHVPEGCDIGCSADHLLAVEAKLSLSTSLEEFSQCKKTSGKPWWLLASFDSHSFLAKALFLNEGEKS